MRGRLVQQGEEWVERVSDVKTGGVMEQRKGKEEERYQDT